MIYSPNQSLGSMLAPSFTHKEVARSQIADRNGIPNIPSQVILERARILAISVLQPVRSNYGIPFSPNSWYRSEEVEKILCWRSFVRWCEKRGIPSEDQESWDAYFSRKQHPTGMAADIEIPSISNDSLFEWIKENLTFDQLIREFPRKGDPTSGWVHVSYDSDGNRQQAFTIGGR